MALPRLGHPLIDRQHRQLERIGRALVAALRRGGGVQAPLARLTRETRRHFACEERLMRQAGDAYPLADGHRALHQGMLEDMQRLRALLAGGACPHHRHGQQVLAWLAHHVDEADRNLVAAWRRALARTPARAASAHALAARRRGPRPGL